MKTFEQIANWEFHNKGKLVQKLTPDQIAKICDSPELVFGCRIGGMWSGGHPNLEMGNLCPKYPKATLVVYYSWPSVHVQVYHEKIWSGQLGTSPKYDRIVADFVKSLNN